VVTGAASGIGRGLAEELARRNVFVVLADRQVELAGEVADGIRKRGGAAEAVALDVRDAARFREVVREAAAARGRLDYLFNNAGIGIGGETSACDVADFDDLIDVNLKGVVHGVLAAYPIFIAQGYGHIVNTASMAGLSPTPMVAGYTATKYAVVGFSRALRMEARRHGVRVSVVCPGLVRTPIWEGGRYGRFKPGLDPKVLAARAERLGPVLPERFATRVLDAVERNRSVIVEPKRWRLAWYLERLSPWLVDKIGERLLEFALRDLGPKG
jgi:NADP-dependent 3-hydroxy acid dehydrogenase YdfG